MTISPDFSVASTTVTAALAAFLLIAEPWLGRRAYGSLARRRDAEPRALVRYFTFVLGAWWAYAAVAVAALLLSPGVDAADLGITAPERPVYTIVLIILFAAVTVASGRNFRGLAEQGKNVPGLSSVEAMLPRTGKERGLAVAVAVTDGICAELVYRGLLIAFGIGVLGLNSYLAVALSAVVYALAGSYQGRQGMAAFALFGVFFGGLYLATGSLLLPVVAHVALSLRDLTLPAPDKLRAAPAA
ncbi:CPBP family intramembrane glutamic endopeptidase [Streptomyces luteocolor]|uniref:CPBP family intramembrane glutamic endopeptidase n=1 Tax=Streptomyces luteocolor TaxID=285500 RepID=UPI000AF74A2C|nr:CPBP family intramembrane glutamic endopeptidase [Streptomyces luteocolor]